MKNTLNNLVLAIFLGLISQGIHAQFDDIYYDPDNNRAPAKETRNNHQTDRNDNYSRQQTSHLNPNDTGYEYDDQNSEWANQDYYYTSRIKRFHRPYLGFDYYNNCYVDNYYYDPYSYNPYYYGQDIYVTNYGYYDYYRWRRWQLSPFHSYSYWNQWDWYFGWSSYPFGFSYCYWPYGGYYNNYGYYNSYYPYYGGYYNDNHHPNGTHYGSRRFGFSNSSNRGPVRVVSPSPRNFTEAGGGVHATPVPNSGNSGRVLRSADGDKYVPSPAGKTERAKTDALPGNKWSPSDRSSSNPKEFPGNKGLPSETRHVPKSDRKSNDDKSDWKRPEFKPERMHRDEMRRERNQESSPRTESPREMPRENRSEPRMERRMENSESHRSRSESSGSQRSGGSHESSGGGRRSHR